MEVNGSGWHRIASARRAPCIDNARPMKTRSLRRLYLLGLAACTATISACSPVFDWRELRDAERGNVLALLPCKPDRASRQVELAGDPAVLQMAGCKAGDALFSVAQARASDAAQALRWQAGWQAAMPAGQAEAAIGVAGAGPLLDVQVKSEQGGAQRQRLLWRLLPLPDGSVVLLQASLLGEPSDASAVDTFFDSLARP